MEKYVCKICGYVYDPAENNNVPFEELPEDWTCPKIGRARSAEWARTSLKKPDRQQF